MRAYYTVQAESHVKDFKNALIKDDKEKACGCPIVPVVLVIFCASTEGLL